MDQSSYILYKRNILDYVDFINKQYIFWLKKAIKLPAFANSADVKSKKGAKPNNIEFWHLRIRHLGYKSLITLKNLCSKIDFKAIISSKLCKNC